MADSITTKFTVEGEQAYTQAISRINKAYRSLDTELNAVMASMGKQATEQEKAAAKVQILTKQLDKQKTAVSELETHLDKQKQKLQESAVALEKAKSQHEDNSKEVLAAQAAYDGWSAAVEETQGKLNTATANVTRLTNEIDSLQDEVSGAAQKERDLAAAQKKQAEASEAAAKEIAFYAEHLNKALNKTVAFAAAAGSAAIALGTKVVTAYGEMEQAVGGAEAVFGEYANQLIKTSQTASRTLGTSQAEYLAVANKMGALFQGSGLSVERSMELTTQAIERAADAASVMGIDVSSALEAVTGAAKGNYTMMDNLGVAMNATTLEAYRLEKGMETAFSKMSNAEKAELALSYFFERTAKYAGNFKRESAETIEGSLNSLSASFKSFVAGLGDPSADIQQMTEDVADAFVNVVDNVAPVIKQAARSIPNVLDTITAKTGGLNVSLNGLLTPLKAIAITGGTLVVGIKALNGLSSLAKQAKNISETAPAIGNLITSLSSPQIAITTAAVIGAVGAFALLATTVDDVRKQTDEYYRSAAESAAQTRILSRNLEELRDNYDTAVSSAKETEEESLALLSIYERLSQKTNRTAGETAQLKEVSKQLAETIPELSEAYNTQTGLLDANADSIEKLIRVKAQEAEANALLEKAVEAQVNYNKALKNQQEIADKIAAAKARIAEIDTGSVFKGFEQSRLESDLQQMQIAYAKAQIVTEQYATEVEDVTGQLNTLTEATETNTAATQENSTETAAAAEEISEAMEEIQEAYEKTWEAARNSLDSQIGEWDKIENKTKTSIEEMIAAKESQIAYLQNYTANFQALTSRNIEGINELAATFTDGSLESAAALEALSTATDEEVTQVIASMRQTGELKDILATNFADANTAALGQLTPEEFRRAGENCGQGYANGISSKEAEVQSAARRLAKAGQVTICRIDQIASPSKAYAKLGAYDGEGFANGLISGVDRVKSAAATLSDAAFSSVSKASAALGNIPMGGTAANASSTSVAYGGITLNVYGSAGQDINALAEIVMSKIQMEVTRREAAFA